MKPVLIVLTLYSSIAVLSAGTIEDWIEAAENPEELSVWLDDLREHPLDLNRATVEQIGALPYFDERTAKLLFQERAIVKGFTTLEQVLGLGIVNDSQRQILRILTTVQPFDPSASRVRIRTAAKGERQDAEPFGSKTVQSRTRCEFSSPDGMRGYLFAFRHSDISDFYNGVSAGLEFPSHQLVPRILLGDFQNEAGSGLVFASAHGLANWLAAANRIAPGASQGLMLRPTTAGLSRLRGAAVGFESGSVGLDLLFSDQHLDAKLENGEVVRIVEGETASSELSKTRRDQVREALSGATMRVRALNTTLGLSGYRAHFSPEIKSSATVSTPSYVGNELDLGSIFFTGNLRQLSWLTEVAKSSPGGMAHQSMVGLNGDRLGCAIYHVFAEEDFYSPHSRMWGGFSQEAHNSQVTGARMLLVWPYYSLCLNGQLSKTPYRTETSPLSKSSNLAELRWTVHPLRMADLEILTSRRMSEATSSESPARDLRVDRGRLDVTFRTGEEYKIRFEIRSAHGEMRSDAVGTLLFFQTKASILGLNVFGRLTFFDFENDDVSMNAYENSLYGSYPLTALNGTGRRAALMISRRWAGLSTGLKVAHTSQTQAMDEQESLECSLEFGFRR
jgi:hypothetical protein